jgi:hypothetical protein
MNEKKGKPKFPPTVEDQETIVTLRASGLSQTKIAQTVGRSRSLVKNVLAKPEVKKAVIDEKAELAAIYREKARAVVTSISDADIGKASLQQKAIASGILLDKSLILFGEAPTINIHLLLEVVAAIKAQRTEDSDRYRLEYQQRHALPPPEPAP